VIGRVELERDLVIVACAISAGIHAALTPGHFAEGAGAGLGFLLSAVLLAGLAVALTRGAGRSGYAATVLTLTGLIVAYVLAITSGMPVLHPEPEPVDGLALGTKAIEVAGLVAAAHLLLQGRSLALIRTEGKLT
jgi:drug/metabolite transporter (DMT)-like permease